MLIKKYFSKLLEPFLTKSKIKLFEVTYNTRTIIHYSWEKSLPIQEPKLLLYYD